MSDSTSEMSDGMQIPRGPVRPNDGFFKRVSQSIGMTKLFYKEFTKVAKGCRK